MRVIDQTGQFKRDVKREARGPHSKTLEADLLPVLEALAMDAILDARYRDHALTGNWKNVEIAISSRIWC